MQLSFVKTKQEFKLKETIYLFVTIEIHAELLRETIIV